MKGARRCWVEFQDKGRRMWRQLVKPVPQKVSMHFFLFFFAFLFLRKNQKEPGEELAFRLKMLFVIAWGIDQPQLKAYGERKWLNV